MNPPPPILPAEGQTTASANPTATAASTAFPPRFRTSTPTREAISLTEETIPRFPRTGGRAAASTREAGRISGRSTNEGSGAVINPNSTSRTTRRDPYENSFSYPISSSFFPDFRFQICDLRFAHFRS